MSERDAADALPSCGAVNAVDGRLRELLEQSRQERVVEPAAPS